MNIAKMAARLAKKDKKPQRILQKASDGEQLCVMLFELPFCAISDAMRCESYSILAAPKKTVFQPKKKKFGFDTDLTDTSTKAVKILRHQGNGPKKSHANKARGKGKVRASVARRHSHAPQPGSKFGKGKK